MRHDLTSRSGPNVGMPDADDFIDAASGDDVSLGTVLEGIDALGYADTTWLLSLALLAALGVFVIFLRC